MMSRLNGFYLAVLQRFVEEVAPDLDEADFPAYALDFARRFKHHPAEVVADILEVAGIAEPTRPGGSGGAISVRPRAFPTPSP